MAAPLDPYVKLVLGEDSIKNRAYLICLRTTADFYGWSVGLPTWAPKELAVIGGRSIGHDPGRKGSLKLSPGKRLRISRSSSTAGNPAGLTNAFRISNQVGVRHLAQLAHVTEGDWSWMQGLYGERITRERWAEIYQKSISRVRGGLVSV